MSSPYGNPYTSHEGTMLGSQMDHDADEGNSEIPRRIMRVKVLYTFDNENKTHCLARLGRPVSIPVIPLDESTEVGVVKLRTCIQAIVAASPEMISKLENDYTVYALDFSEYETPLVGQGMLSRVLASVSPTPAAAASDSEGMVTGRVCKNIMGLFQSGGIKETLEVKLKLVPVPTRSRHEYLQSMAGYRDLGISMPEGFMPDMWSRFLQAIPDAGVLRGETSGQTASRAHVGGLEQLHEMLTPKFGPEDDAYSHAPGSSRAGSPTPSQRSISNFPTGHALSRPASRGSYVRQEEVPADDTCFEDGPARKRARPQQVDYHGRPSFGMKANSLQAHVSTSASIRHFRPSAISGTSASSDMLPRAPTPRAAEKRGGRTAVPRAASGLRRESTGAMSPYALPEQEPPRHDSGISSLGYEDDRSSRNGSPASNFPSSPPEFTPAEAASSPLPESSNPPDSGFQSDQPAQADKPKPIEKINNNPNVQRKARGEIAWQHVQPGPLDQLPQHSSSQFDPLTQKSAIASANWNQRPASPNQRPANRRGGRAPSKLPQTSAQVRQTSTTPSPFDATSPGTLNPHPSIEATLPPTTVDSRNPALMPQTTGMPPNVIDRVQRSIPTSMPQPSSSEVMQHSNYRKIAPPPHEGETSRLGPASSSYEFEVQPVQARRNGRPAKRAFRKTQSWIMEASSDVESDGGLAQESAEGRRVNSKSGSGAIRSRSINKHLETALATGAPVRFCSNCGDIKTPTWRPYWLKVEDGDGSDKQLGSKTGIHMVAPTEKNDQGVTVKHQVWKQYGHLTPDEKTNGSYVQLYYCNPCGDFIRKYGLMRPREMYDAELKEQLRSKRGSGRRRSKKKGETLTSDFPTPSDAMSDIDFNIPYNSMSTFTDPLLPSELNFVQSDLRQAFEFGQQNDTQGTQELPDHQSPSTRHDKQLSDSGSVNQQECAAATGTLQRAVQSSPARQIDRSTHEIERKSVSPKTTRRLLFPSPRRAGEFKSLNSAPADQAKTNEQEVSTTISKTRADGEALAPLPMELSLEIDKENQPPPFGDDDDFAHLFEEGIFQSPSASSQKTPSKAIPRTPKSQPRHISTGLTPRSASTPKTGSKRNAACMGPPDTPTPGKRRSPRIAERQRHECTKEMTPFSRSLNQLLSDGVTSSPSKMFGWTLSSSPAKDLSKTFGDIAAVGNAIPRSDAQHPARRDQQNSRIDGNEDANLWSEYPLSSSPPFFGQTHDQNADEQMQGYDWGALDQIVSEGVHVWEDGTATDGIEMRDWDAVFREATKDGQGVAILEAARDVSVGQPAEAAADSCEQSTVAKEIPVSASEVTVVAAEVPAVAL